MKRFSPRRYARIFVALALMLPAAFHARAYADDDMGGGTESESSSETEGDNGVAEEDYNGSDAAGSMRGFSNENEDVEQQNQGGSTALQEEHILSLDSITAKTQELTDGRILDAELKPRHNGLRYEVKVLENDDRLHRYSFDAHDGRLIGVK